MEVEGYVKDIVYIIPMADIDISLQVAGKIYGENIVCLFCMPLNGKFY